MVNDSYSLRQVLYLWEQQQFGLKNPYEFFAQFQSDLMQQIKQDCYRCYTISPDSTEGKHHPQTRYYTDYL